MKSFIREAVAAGAVAAVVAAYVLRPLLSAPGSLPRYVGPHAAFENADRNLNLWILAWTARAALRDPGHLFDGNIYFPAANTLAGSETMLAHLPLLAPVWRATGDATAVLKAEMAWGIAGTALAVYALARFAGMAPFAAALVAAAVALEPGRVNPLGTGNGLAAQPQYLGFQYAPLALLAIVAWARGRTRAGAIGLALALALQALACFYLGYYAFVTVPLFGAFLLATGHGARALAGLAASVAAAGALVLPVALRYVAARDAGAVRVPDPSLPWRGSLLGAGFAAGAAWVGPLALGLAFVGIAAALGRRRGVAPESAATPGDEPAIARASWLLALSALVLALGPELRLGSAGTLPLPHGWLAAIVPGFGILRGPMRALSLATLGASLAGGLALARAGALWPPRARAAIAVAGVAAAALWLAWTPVAIDRSPLGGELPPVYRWLASQPVDGPVLEVPGAASEEDLGGLARESRYMAYSTRHWHPLVNGYTAYPPVWGELAKSLARRLPDRDALQTLVDLAPVRWVIAHRDFMGNAERSAWDASAPEAGLALRATFGGDAVYAVDLAPSADWRGAIVDPPRGVTLEGTSTAPLPQTCRRADLRARFPAEMRAALTVRAVPTRVENRGDCTWPALSIRPEGLVVLTAGWVDAPPGTAPPVVRARLPRDLAPGSGADVDALVLTPGVPGRYRLRLDLAQEGGGPPLASAEGVVDVLPGRTAVPPSAAPGAAPADAGATE